MNKKNIIKALAFGLLSAAALSSCSDDFLEEKTNVDNVGIEIYNDYDGANLRLNDLYKFILPDCATDAGWNNNATGRDDDQGKSTEEYSGFSIFVDPQKELLASNSPKVPDYFHNQGNNIQASVWGRIRMVNDFLEGMEGSTLSEDLKNELTGQALFLRAWCYYQLVKWYGSVPIITEVLAPVMGNYTPRSTARACFDFIVNDLNMSAQKLGTKRWADAQWGHVDAAAALALKGRVLNLWASPMFNRKNDKTRWENAYKEQLKDIETINALGHGLYSAGGALNATDFATVFAKSRTDEALFVTLYNTSSLDDGKKNNNWENSIRPRNIGGNGGKEASAMLVDMFPMADGKVPTTCKTYTTLDRSEYPYDSLCFFMNRDPRFYRTFAFPGVRWGSLGSTSNVGQTGHFLPEYSRGYELWNYVWYTKADDAGNVESGDSYAADSLLSSKRGVYVRKRSVDADLPNAEALYAWSAANAKYSVAAGYSLSGAPFIEIRYAEVLLNLAEAAAGSGNLAKAVECLKMIRERVGYTGDCGLTGIDADEAKCMAAVLYERQIELAYEGKRFDDCRRWMLYDGGAVRLAGAPDTWTLTGWGGNTCTWLGFKPLNGQRRDNMQFRVADVYGVGTNKAESDPIMSRYLAAEAAMAEADEAIRQANKSLQAAQDSLDAGVWGPREYRQAVNECNAAIDAANKKYDENAVVYKRTKRCDALNFQSELALQTEALAAWYKTNLVRKEMKADARDSQHNDLYINFRPNYYFLGLTNGALSNNRELPQVIGWEDSNNGGAPGTFDPLAE